MRDRLRARYWSVLAAVFAAGLAYRAFQWTRMHVPVPSNDYSGMAGQILAGAEIVPSRLPLYSCFIALVEVLSPGAGVKAVVAAQVALNAWVTALVFALACALSSPIAGLAAAALLLANEPYAMSNFAVEVEFFFSFLAIGVVAQYLLWCREGSWRRALALAAAIGLCLSARSTFFLLPLFLLAWHALSPFKGRPGGRSLWLVLGCFAMLVPWTLRNFTYSRRFIPFEDGVEFVRVYQASLGAVQAGLVETGQVQAIAVSREPKLQGVDPSELNRLFFRLAWENVTAAPAAFAAGCLERLWCWLCYNKLLSILFFVALLWPGLGELKWALATVPVYLALIHAPLTLSPRLTVPAIPALCVLAGGLIDAVIPGTRALPEASSMRDYARLDVIAGLSLALAAIPYFFSVWACR